PLVEATASTSMEASASSRKAPTANSRRGPRDVFIGKPRGKSASPSAEQRRGEDEVEHQDQQRGVDHGAGGRDRGAFDGGFGVEADVGRDQRRGAAEDRRLQERDQ